MRIPLSWLQDFVSLSLSPEEIAKALTMTGLEVDHYETIGDNLQDIVIAQVLEAQKHPNADKLSLTSVTDGTNTYQVVCGAPNCRAGMKVALARVGATLQDSEGSFKIKKTKIRGIESEGMLCSGKELGISDEHEGILDLPEHFVVGSSLREHYADTFFDISLTPNLGHCTSVMGVARELAAITGQPLRLPKCEVKEGKSLASSVVQLKVIDQKGCPRYMCRVIRDVKVAPSPLWLVKRLEKCGLRSVNNVVDVTNYVLFEFGHPLHAFDLNKLSGHEIIVRRAQEGEIIQTIDQKTRTLKENMLLICDAKRPVAIAGVMGGGNSEVDETTHDIVLESAYFDAMSVRLTSKQLGLQTDASKRFERGTDPNQLQFVLDLAASMIVQVAGGEVLSGILEAKEQDFLDKSLSCRLSRINRIIGREFSRGEVEEIFRRLGFACKWDGVDQFLIQVPTFRCDINEEVDLIEEVARLYGYDNIPRHGQGYQASTIPSVPIYLFEREVAARLIGEGLQEFLTCDLIGPALLNVVQHSTVPQEAMVKVLNPTSIEQSVLRTSLLPGLLQVVKYNCDHQNRDIAGFEVGQIHFFDGTHYKEQSVAAIILTGVSSPLHFDRKPQDFDFFDLKGIVENLLHTLGIQDVQFKNLKLETFHSGRQASIFVGSLEIGSIGEIHPAIQRRLDVSQRILFGEFNLQDLASVTKRLEKITPLALYPCSERDWTTTIRDSISYEEIVSVIEREQSKVLEEVSVKDIYRSEKLPPGHHNITLHFVYRDPLKTIEQDVVDKEQLRLTTAVLNHLKTIS